MSVFEAYARYYDLLYADKPYEAEAKHVIDLAKRYGAALDSLIEMGVGTGGHAVHFMKHVKQVDGVDMSDEMLAAATTRRASLPKGDADRLGLVNGDVRTVRLDRKATIVVSMFHVMSYQTSNADIRAALQTARHHLDRDGIFVFDFWHGPGVLTEPPVRRERTLDDARTHVKRIAEPVLHPREDVVDVNYTIDVTDRASGASQRLKETHRMRYFFEPELRLLLEEASLEPLEATGWMRFDAPTERDWTAAVVARAV